jgi:hypothetical protein
MYKLKKVLQVTTTEMLNTRNRHACRLALILFVFGICLAQSTHLAMGTAVSESGSKSGAEINKPIKDKWAVVIGVSNFKDSSINLRFAAKDARDFAEYLTTQGNFQKDHVLLLTDEKATRENILTALGDKWLPRLANPDDLVMVFVSSHGSPADLDVGGINYIVVHDTNIDCLYATAIPLQYLIEIIRTRVHSDRVIMILDTCHSGAARVESKGLKRINNVDAQAIVAGTGQMVIASSSPSQRSWEGKGYDNSVFTHHLINALKSGGSKTTLGAAFESMKEGVQEEVLRDRGTLQTPVIKSAWKGDELAIATLPTKIRSAAVDWAIEPSPPIATASSQPSTKAPAPDKIAHAHVTPGMAVPAKIDSNVFEIEPLPAIPPVTVLDNGNIYKVFNKPTRSTFFSLSYPALLTYIYTYHWNDARGFRPGQIAVQHEDGTTYGPWRATGKPGQGGVPNAYWESEPLVQLKPGTYTIVDSHPPSWSQNEGSRGAGFARVRVAPLVDTVNQSTGKALRRSPEIIFFKNGNIYAVHNGGSQPTFSVKVPTLVTKVGNYHWNYGRGARPGKIALRHEDGTTYGPWQANGRSGQGGAPEAYWECPVDLVIKPGTYRVIDSDPATWSQNELTNGAGMSEITGVYQD